MNALDLNAIEIAKPIFDPFEHVIVPEVISKTHLSSVIDEFPEVNKSGSFPVSDVKCGPNFKILMKELNSEIFSKKIGSKLGIDLSNKPRMITIRGYCRPSDGKIHTDSKGKLVTVLIYLNSSWQKEGGRLRLLYNNHDMENFAAEVPPYQGSMVAFACHPHSWHGHRSYEGNRKMIQLNWVVSRSYKIREELRHNLSSHFKKFFS